MNIFEQSGTQLDPYLASAVVAAIRSGASALSSLTLRFSPRRPLMLASGTVMAGFMAIMGATSYVIQMRSEEGVIVAGLIDEGNGTVVLQSDGKDDNKANFCAIYSNKLRSFSMLTVSTP